MGKIAEPIALVHDFLFTFGGAERVLQALHHLFPQAPIYTAFTNPEVVHRHFPEAHIIASGLQRNPFRRWPRLLIGSMPLAMESFDLSAYATVISSSGAFSHGVITGPQTQHITYCHSPMRYAWDYRTRYFGEQSRGGPIRALATPLLNYLRLWDSVAALRPDSWIANSHTVQARIHKYYRVESTVIYPPVDTVFFDREQVGEPISSGSYVVTVSRLTPNKRIDLMITACKQAGMPLVIAGEGRERPRLEALANQKKSEVRFVGRVSEEEKRRLIAGATCFLFAAEDDFGIAPVEALATGTPVVAYRAGGATETIQHGKNGRFFETLTPEALAAELNQIQAGGISLDPLAIRQTALPFSETAFRTNLLQFLEAHA